MAIYQSAHIWKRAIILSDSFDAGYGCHYGDLFRLVWLDICEVDKSFSVPVPLSGADAGSLGVAGLVARLGGNWVSLVESGI